jgi:hypothetical protein
LSEDQKEKTQVDCEMENEYNALCDINATHCYLPTDMEEDNPLDLENIKESSNTWGHIAKYMGTHFQIHGDSCKHKKYIYNIYGDRLLIQNKIHGISLITMHGMRAGVHSTLGSSPGSRVFNRDMFLNMTLIVDWHAITQRQEHFNHENLMRNIHNCCFFVCLFVCLLLSQIPG